MDCLKPFKLQLEIVTCNINPATCNGFFSNVARQVEKKIASCNEKSTNLEQKLYLPYKSIPYKELPYISIHYKELPCISIQYKELPYISIHYKELPYISIHYKELPYISIHYKELPYISIHYQELRVFLIIKFGKISNKRRCRAMVIKSHS